jgi:hypothetical protein
MEIGWAAEWETEGVFGVAQVTDASTVARFTEHIRTKIARINLPYIQFYSY